jgi:hypothetical protein
MMMMLVSKKNWTPMHQLSNNFLLMGKGFLMIPHNRKQQQTSLFMMSMYPLALTHKKWIALQQLNYNIPLLGVGV